MMLRTMQVECLCLEWLCLAALEGLGNRFSSFHLMYSKFFKSTDVCCSKYFCKLPCRALERHHVIFFFLQGKNARTCIEILCAIVVLKQTMLWDDELRFMIMMQA